MKITDKHGQQWQLVPIEPTKDMVLTGEDAYVDQLDNRLDCKDRKEWPSEENCELPARVAYRAMLSAAPEPDLPEGLEPVAVCKDFYTLEWEPRYARRLEDGTILVLQSAALAELAKKKEEISKLANKLKYSEMAASVEAGEANNLRNQVQRQAALIEKCRYALDHYANGGSNYRKIAAEALDAIEEFKK